MAETKTISLIGKQDLSSHKEDLSKLIQDLKSQKYQLIFDPNFSRHFQEPASTNNDLLKSDLILVFGGDGTLLKTARKINSKNLNILPVNLGNLGFLTESDISTIQQDLHKYFQGQYELDKRFLLDVKIVRKGETVLNSHSLNEAVIHQGGKSRLINLHIDVSGKPVCSLKADGLILSTPTGSTGHSLSAGGPIIHPHINAFLITPICPISLSNRPIAVPSDRSIHITVERNREYAEKIGLTLDGQESYQLEYDDKIIIKQSTQTLQIIRMLDSNYYQSLRDKLNWSK